MGKRAFAVLISIIGLVMTLNMMTISGAVIGVPAEPVLKIGGIVIFLAGIALFIVWKEKKIYNVEEVEDSSNL